MVRFNLSLQSFTYLEASEVRNVVERYLVNIDDEASLPRPLTEGLLTQTLCLVHLKLALVALLLESLSLRQAHRMRVLVRLSFSQLERVQTEALAERREAECLHLHKISRTWLS